MRRSHEVDDVPRDDVGPIELQEVAGVVGGVRKTVQTQRNRRVAAPPGQRA
jgi:hypothetical protein